MIPIKANLPFSTAAFIESRADEFPEFQIGTQPLRSYPEGRRASHVLGYLSEISEGLLRQSAHKNYRMGDAIGMSGIERQYEGSLRGEKGTRTFIKDNLEKIQKVIGETKPVIGDTVVLTIDMNLQRFIEDSLAAEKGTVGVVDLRTGGILALVSKPDFDPEIFSAEMDMDDWLSIVDDPEKPLQDKFVQGVYSPGSVFKIVMALAGLQEKVIDPSTRVFCRGRPFFTIGFFTAGNRTGTVRSAFMPRWRNRAIYFSTRWAGSSISEPSPAMRPCWAWAGKVPSICPTRTTVWFRPMNGNGGL